MLVVGRRGLFVIVAVLGLLLSLPSYAEFNSEVLGDAVEQPELIWEFGGSGTWTPETGDFPDGDILLGETVEGNEAIWLETTISGPAVVSFYVTTSYGFYGDGTGKLFVDGESAVLFSDRDLWGWTRFEYAITGEGEHVLRWLYNAESYCYPPFGCGYYSTVSLDRIEIDRSPIILSQPTHSVANEGESVVFSVEVLDGDQLEYQWRKNGVEIDGANESSLSISDVSGADEAAYDVVVTNSIQDSKTSDIARFHLRETLGEALDQPSMAWKVGGNGQWSLMSTESQDGVDGLAAHVPERFGEAWLETTVVGPGRISYHVKMIGARRQLFLDDARVSPDFVSASSDWGKYEYVISDDKTHTLKWLLENDNSGEVSSRMYLDQVEIDRLPVIVERPLDSIIAEGDEFAFSVEAIATTPLEYQWRKNGVELDGENGPSLTFSSPSAEDEGEYDVVVSNVVEGSSADSNDMFGSTVSEIAKLVVDSEFGEAIDLEGVILTPEGRGVWLPQSEHSYDGKDALVLSFVENGSWASISATFAGRGLLRFYVKLIGSDEGYLYVDGNEKADFYDDKKWALYEYLIPDDGEHDVEWSYTGWGWVGPNPEDEYNTMYIDQVSFFKAPEFAIQPTSAVVTVGNAFEISAKLLEEEGVSYQWMRDDVAIDVATSSTLRIEDASLDDGGSYRVVATNSGGESTSEIATLSVLRQTVFIEESQTVGVGAGLLSLNIQSDVSWFVSEGLDWIIVNQNSGQGDQLIEVTVNENQYPYERIGTLELKASFEGSEILDTFTITQQRNVQGVYSIVPLAQDSSISPSFRIANDGNERYAMLWLDEKNGTGKLIVICEEEGLNDNRVYDVISIDENSIELGGDGLASVILILDSSGMISGNLDCIGRVEFEKTLSSDPNKYSGYREFEIPGGDDGRLHLIVSPLGEAIVVTTNVTDESLQISGKAEVSIGGLLSIEMQGGKAQSAQLNDVNEQVGENTLGPLVLSSNTTGFDPSNQIVEIPIISLFPWEVSTSADWLEVVEKHGVGNGLITVEVEANESQEMRSTMIEISGEVFEIKQKGRIDGLLNLSFSDWLRAYFTAEEIVDFGQSPGKEDYDNDSILTRNEYDLRLDPRTPFGVRSDRREKRLAMILLGYNPDAVLVLLTSYNLVDWEEVESTKYENDSSGVDFEFDSFPGNPFFKIELRSTSSL